MFKILNSMNRIGSFNDKIESFYRNHGYSTRYFNNFNLPFYRTGLCQRSVFYQGPKLWNLLPVILKNCRSVYSFKKNFKCFLLDKY